MTQTWLYLSLKGRLSRESFARAFWPIAFIGITVFAFTPTRRAIGYPLDHWAGLAYSLIAAWPLFALTAKRLHDGERGLALAIPAAAGFPAAEALWLVLDSSGLPIIPSRVLVILMASAWCVLMWQVYRLPGSPGANAFGAQAL